MLNKNNIKLIKDIWNTRSSYKLQNIVLNYLIENEENEDIKKDLLHFVNSEVKEQSETGKRFVNRRYTKNKKDYKYPKFFIDNKSDCKCESCGIPVNSACWKLKNGSYHYWHPLAECLPEEWKDYMLDDKDYKKWKNKE